MSKVFFKIKKSAGRVKRRVCAFINEKVASMADLFIAAKSHPAPDKSAAVYIAVSTTKGYAEKTIPLLIANLEKIGVPKNMLYVFEGGHTEKSIRSDNGYHHYLLDNNSFDITALIGVVELDLPQQYWLLLHDTITLKHGFKNLLYKIDPCAYECMPLRDSPSMNIGIYSKVFLLANKNYLLNFRNKDYSAEGLLKTKEKACKEEDYLFSKTSEKRNIHSRLAKFEYIKLVKYFGQLRLLEGYPQLGLLKYKANGSSRVMKDFPQLAKVHLDSNGLERTVWTLKL